MKKWIALVAAISAILPAALSDKQNDQANALYAQIQQSEAARMSATSYEAGLKAYETAEKTLKDLLSTYPDSTIAGELKSGKVQINGFTPDQYLELKPALEPLADAGKDPFLCAIRVADTIEGGIPKAEALNEITDECLNTGQIQPAALALNLALGSAFTINIQKPEDAAEMAALLARISILSTKAGLEEMKDKVFTCALKAADACKNEDDRKMALSRIAIEFADTRDFERAFDAFGRIDGLYMRSITLADIAGCYIDANQEDKAAQTLSQAHEAALNIENENHRHVALGKVAEIFAASGQSAQAREIIATIPNTPTNQAAIAKVLLVIAEQEATAGLADEAQATASEIPLKNFEARAYLAVAAEDAKVDRKVEAEQMLDRAINTAQATESTEQIEILRLVAEMYAEIGQISKAKEVVMAIPDEVMRPDALSKVVDRLLDIGDMKLALKTAQTIDDKFFQATSLAKIAGKDASMQQNEKAAELLSQAQSITQTIDDIDVRDEALATIASRYADADRFPEALETAAAIKDAIQQTQALTAIAGMRAKLNFTFEQPEFDLMAKIIITRYPMKMAEK